MADVKNEEANEIKCRNKSKCGVSYELILAEPVAVTPPIQPSSPRNKVSMKNIEEKLKAAEERRLSLQANRVALLTARMITTEEAPKKGKGIEINFISQKQKSLERGMETQIKKQESYINDFKSRWKEIRWSAEKTILSLKMLKNEEENALKKLKRVAAQRDEYIKKSLDKLEELDEQMQRFLAVRFEKVEQMESQLQSKLKQAQTRSKQFQQK
jgi:hypothetical protein